MENFNKMCLEYKKQVNNSLKHKRQIKKHNISKELLISAYKSYLPFLTDKLIDVNNCFDDMGFKDLENYEKWLLNVREWIN